MLFRNAVMHPNDSDGIENNEDRDHSNLNLHCLFSSLCRVTTVRKKYLENEVFFKSGNFVYGRGKLERTWKVRERSENLKINGYGRQSSKNVLILFKRGDVLSHEIV